uniref:SRR1-like domain-containing protein n=2 Tax=Schistocephalus solidus TaxID=70667 RepID=A0A0X3PGJ9_SCHSO
MQPGTAVLRPSIHIINDDDEEDEQGWKCALSKGMRRRLRRAGLTSPPRIRLRDQTTPLRPLQRTLIALPDDTPEALQKKFSIALDYFERSCSGRQFVTAVLTQLDNVFTSLRLGIPQPPDPGAPIFCLCLGLGNPAVDRSSLRQLALLTTLVKHTALFKPSKTYFYDPLLRQTSREFIRRLGFRILCSNTEGKYVLPQSHFTLAFLPHCPPALADSLLAANWSSHSLQRLVFYSCSLAPKSEADARLLVRLNRLRCLLTSIKPACTTEQDFEGMRIECFNPDGLACLPASLWDPTLSTQSSDTTLRPLLPDVLTTACVSTFLDPLQTGEETFSSIS